jgi:rhamnosyltransferase
LLQEIYDLGLLTSHTPPRSASCALVIPTCNAAPEWDRLSVAINSQNISPDQVLIIDSTSDDETRALVRSAGYRLVVIPRASFRHGATRALAAALVPEAEFLIYLTQDAIPSDGESFAQLMECFEDPLVGAAYGRQLPRPRADAIERHARLFNYPGVSAVRDFASRSTLGFRAAYFSDSFAAYRRSAFDEVGGFPDHVIVSEEVSVAARMLVAGWKVVYNAEARVYHSHDLSLHAEFSRYFDIAVHHNQERWIIDRFGSVGDEGMSFVRSELKYLWKHEPQLIPLAMLRNLSKWIAYQCGQRQHMMPLWLKRAFSANPSHWNEQRQGFYTGTPVAARTGDGTLRESFGSEIKSGR